MKEDKATFTIMSSEEFSSPKNRQSKISNERNSKVISPKNERDSKVNIRNKYYTKEIKKFNQVN